MFASFFAWFGVGSVVGILFTCALLIPLFIYFVYKMSCALYICGSVLIRGIDPRTGKPPKTLEELKKNPQNP